jgi:ribose 5-phosphate isomerase A
MENLKKKAALAAVERIEPDMLVGIGTGSTAEAFIYCLSERVQNGLQITGVPTSKRSEELCRVLSIPLTTLEEVSHLDITVDGTDEVDPCLNLIKGGGGALLREKIVASASRQMIVIADNSKRVEHLGAFPLPVEVIPFGLTSTLRHIEKALQSCGITAELTLRAQAHQPFVTDEGHWIVDAACGRIDDPSGLAARLSSIPGVVEHGLFIDLASCVYLASSEGVEMLTL